MMRVLPLLLRELDAARRARGGPEPVPPAQMRILDLLRERDYQVGELARELRVSSPSLSVTVDALAQRGLVARSRELAPDRRGVVLQITPAGRAHLTGLWSILEERLGEILRGCRPEEQAALAAGLAALGRVLAGERARPAPLQPIVPREPRHADPAARPADTPAPARPCPRSAAYGDAAALAAGERPARDDTTAPRQA